MKSQKTKIKIMILLIMLLLLSIIVFSLFKTNYFHFHADTNTQSFYVSPTGSDTNSGTIDQPFATIAKARDAISQLKTAGNFNGATVYLRGGVYELSSSVQLNNSNSGETGEPIVYRNYPGETPVIRGSKTVTGWTPSQNNPNILQADLKSQNLSGLTFPTIYLNGERQILAQTPNYTAPDFSQTDPYAGNWNFASLENTACDKRNMIYNADDLSQPTLDGINQALIDNPTNPPQVNIYSKYDWINDIRNISSIDTNSRQITLSADTSYGNCPKNRYLLRNFPAALDASKEWYHDKTNDIISYMPPKTLDQNDRISIPVVSRAFFLYPNVHDIKIEGLTFEEFGNDGSGTGDSMSSDVIQISDSSFIEISNNTIKDSAGHGLLVQGNSDNINISHNQFYDLGSNGIYIAPNGNHSQNLTTSNIQVSDNTIHDISYEHTNLSGILVAYTVGVVVSHNEIYNLPRNAIEFRANNTIIEYNKIYNVNLLTQDSAGIYGYGNLLTRGNIIRNNYIRNTNGYGKYRWWIDDGPMKFGFGTVGIYIDNAAGGDQVYNNIVVNTEDSQVGCLSDDGGSNNSYTNNICVETAPDNDANSSAGQMDITEASSATINNWQTMQTAFQSGGFNQSIYFAKYPELAAMTDPTNFQPGQFMNNNTIENNIFYFPASSSNRTYWGSNMNTNQTIDNNLFWPGTKTMRVNQSIVLTPPVNTWAGWQALGFDTHSLISDPLFTDPLAGTDGHDDFSLQSSSPALTLGFKQIDTSEIGPKNFSAILSRLVTYKGTFNITSTKTLNVTDVSINGTEATLDNTNDTWALNISLNVGDNTLAITGRNSDNSSSTTTLHLNRHKLGDATGDGTIDYLDLSKLATSWNKDTSPAAGTNYLADFNEDGVVNYLDFSTLATNWKK